MICITDFLAHIRLTMKLQEQMLKNICETWQLTITEGKVISFLYNNPGKDTAADITELRMLSKGNVSQAVESLIQKGLLKRTAERSIYPCFPRLQTLQLPSVPCRQISTARSFAVCLRKT